MTCDPVQWLRVASVRITTDNANCAVLSQENIVDMRGMGNSWKSQVVCFTSWKGPKMQKDIKEISTDCPNLGGGQMGDGIGWSKIPTLASFFLDCSP